ncbi:MAG: rhamnulokinase [Parasporobacterium sp.]|nr:rhamnulokinase [Parasporobacterium sp.]
MIGFVSFRKETVLKYYLAVDIGASSGRHIVGWKEGEELKTEEVFRFPNGVKELDGHLTWDIDALLSNVKEGIAEAKKRFGDISCMSIDTWGVDYVLLKGDETVYPCYGYRDKRTEAVIPIVHGIVPFEELYAHTGIQYQPFNTIYQLYCDKLAGRLEGVTDFLMVPEYLMYRLTGVKKHEYTNATTGGFINAKARDYDREILSKLGLPEKLFGEISMPGTCVGEYEGIKVVLCPTHDTASAVEGLPLPDGAMFLSSGTWSLLGMKLAQPETSEKSRKANFTNEGGVGYIRYLKNIMGLWIIQNLQKMLGISFGEMVDLARSSSYEKLFDVNLPCFLEPFHIREDILRELGETELSDADVINSVYRSLAYSYGQAVRELEEATGKAPEYLYIGGGGAKNQYLNELTEQYTGKKVVALPIEATALGNLKIQMESCPA